MEECMKKKILDNMLRVLIGFQGLSGLLGGFGLIANPTGESMGIPIKWLDGTTFNSYMVPGVILVIVLGIMPLVVYVGLWKEKSWAIVGSLITGFALMIWIAVEIYMIGYISNPPLQMIYGIIGVLITILSLIEAVHKFDTKEPA